MFIFEVGVMFVTVGLFFSPTLSAAFNLVAAYLRSLAGIDKVHTAYKKFDFFYNIPPFLCCPKRSLEFGPS